MKVKGTKMEPIPQQSTKPAHSPTHGKMSAVFLSKWEPKIGVESALFHPGIHHFCTQPEGPQLPFHMQVLSRQAHTRPGMVRVRTAGRRHDWGGEATISTSTGTIEQSISTEIKLDSQESETKSPPVMISLPIRKKRVNIVLPSSSRNQTTPLTTLTSSAVLAREDGDTVDIIGLAKARLKRELKEASPEKSPPESRTPDPKKTLDGSELKGQRGGQRVERGLKSGEISSRSELKSRGSPKSRERSSQLSSRGQRLSQLSSKGQRLSQLSSRGQRLSQLSSRGQRLGSPVVEESVRPSGTDQGDETEMVMMGTKMEVIDNPGR